MEQTSEPKKFPPTAKKLKDLAKKGQFPKTELAEPTIDVLAFALVFVCAITIVFTYMNFLFEVAIVAKVQVVFSLALKAMSILVVVLFLVKLVLTLIQWVTLNKGIINKEALGVKVEKVSPVQGFKNIFGGEALSKSFRKVFELLFLLFLLKYIFDVAGVQINYIRIANNTEYVVYLLCITTVLVTIFYFIFGVSVGVIDYLFEKYHFNKKNMMTFTEIKNEMKETEGAPEVKSERRRKMKAVMQEPMMRQRVPSFALANPTHILIPICYEDKIDKVPIILDISVDRRAQDEKERLSNQGVPIIENKKLTRKIYKKVREGNQELPEEFYKNVAIIISALKRKKYQ